MKKSCFSAGALLFCILAVTVLVGLSLLVLVYFPYTAKGLFGQPSSNLSSYQKVTYSVRLVLGKQALLTKVDLNGGVRNFTISQGESVDSIALTLERNGLIGDIDLFRTYLVYSGMDRGIQAGDYKVDHPVNVVDLAQMLQDATPKEVRFIILPGWRVEEIAAGLETSGLALTPDKLIEYNQNPSSLQLPQILLGIHSLEGYLAPGEYIIPRDFNVEQVMQTFLGEFEAEVTQEMLMAYQNEGLTLGQAVILASMIQREAIHTEEMGMIASVFLNRLTAGMKFDSDATVQYALGFDAATNSWWKSPLTLNDLSVNSPYNTYQVNGFPPAPICNPSLAALMAVAFPEKSPYYYFRAKCDQSGYHNFAESFTQQQQNACP